MKIRKIRLFLIIIWLIIAGLIIWFKVLPLGQAVYSKNYLGEVNLLGGKGFIGNFTPVDRLFKDSKSQVIGDPVYFSIFTPRTFNEVKLTITYRPNLSVKTPIIETGVLVDKTVWRYKMAPLQNDLIDNLKNWSALRQGETLILQKNKVFSDATKALANLKMSDEVAWYNAAELEESKPIKNLTVIKPFQAITIPLRGTHQFYFVANDKTPQEFSLEFSDLNIDKDVDNVEITIYDQSEKIYSETIIDNFGDESSALSRDFSFKFKIPELGLDNKIFKLEIKAGDDIVTRQILAAPSALSAISRLHLATSNKSWSFWTDSSYLQVTATDPAGRQTINFAGQDFKVDEAYTQLEFASDNKKLKEISGSKTDLILENNGTFAFSNDSLLNPNSKQLDRHFLLDDQTQFIVANYTPPQILDNGWRQAVVTLNIKDAYREQGKYSFIISVPGLSLAKKGGLEIADIKAEFSGRTIFDKLREIIKAYVN